MKALSLRPTWATFVLFGSKTIECRSWKTDYRGDLLICSSSRKETGGIPGHALCVVRLDNVREFRESDLDDAVMYQVPEGRQYAWELSDIRYVEPFKCKGKLHLFDVDDSLINYVESDDLGATLRDVYKPLVYFGRDDDARELWDF